MNCSIKKRKRKNGRENIFLFKVFSKVKLSGENINVRFSVVGATQDPRLRSIFKTHEIRIWGVD